MEERIRFSDLVKLLFLAAAKDGLFYNNRQALFFKGPVAGVIEAACGCPKAQGRIKKIQAKR